MSLITLKNDNRQKPWNFRNHFKSPLELPPNSSVSLVSAVVYKGEELNIEDDNNWYGCIGNTACELNPVYKYRIPPTQDTFSPLEIMDEMDDEFNTTSGQPAFSRIGNLLTTSAWKSTWDTTTSKVTVSLTQNPSLVESGEDPAIFPWSANGTLYNLALDATTLWTEIERTATVGSTQDEAMGRIFGLTNDSHQGCIARNGGHILFQPQLNPATNQYDPNVFFGLGETHTTGSALAFFQANANACFGSFYIEQYGPGGATPSRARIMLNDDHPHQLPATPTQLGTLITLDPANTYTYSIEWNGPYTIKIKYSTNYNPAVPATDWLSATWTTWYDFALPANDLAIPTYLDNMSPIVRMDRRGKVLCRATWSRFSGGWDWEQAGLQNSGYFSIEATPVSGIGSDELVGTYPNQQLKKEVKLLTVTTPPFDEEDEWDRDGGILINSEFGKILGFAGATQLLAPDANNTVYTYEGGAPTDNSYLLPTLHIQLTNFGINSKNGIVANNVKDIAVIPQFNDTEKQAINTHLYFAHSYENKIALNNLQTININQIDCLITYDNNTQAEVLKDYTTLVIKFHKPNE